MINTIRLGVLLFFLWLLLSGYWQPLLIGFGLISVWLCIAVARRMAIIDRESYPVRLTGAVFYYWIWLGWQIVKSNIDVTRRILDPALPISPNVTRVKASQRTPLGLVTYANGITLTPGTVSIEIQDDVVEVHALTREAAQELHEGEMDRRVSAMEGGK